MKSILPSLTNAYSYSSTPDSTRLRTLNALVKLPLLNPIHKTLINPSPLMIARLHGPSPLRVEHPSRDTSAFKQMIDILKLQLTRLGEEAIHDRHKEGA